MQPYASNLNKRLVRTPKVFFVDVGVVTRLQGWWSLEPLLVSPQMGPLFETAVFAELVRCRDHRLLGIEIFLWRTRDGEELDFLVRLETCHRGPLWIPIEAKLGGHAALGAAIPPGPDFSNAGAAVAGDWRSAVEGIIRLYSRSSPMDLLPYPQRSERDSIVADARHAIGMTPEERAAVFVGLERTMEAILAHLSPEERRRRREASRLLDPRPTPWWKNLRRSAWPEDDAAT